MDINFMDIVWYRRENNFSSIY